MDEKSMNFVSKHRRLLTLTATVFIIVFVICICLVLRLRLPEQSVICGLDTSDMLYKDAEKLLEEKVNGYSIRVNVGEQVFDMTASDLELNFIKDHFREVVSDAVDSGEAVDPWTVISLDRGGLVSYFEKKLDKKRIPAVPATVVWDDAGGHFKAVPGAPESWLEPQLLADMVMDAISTLAPELEITEDQIYTEEHNAVQLANAERLADQANQLMELELEYVFSPRNVELGRVTIDEAMIASFLRFDYENNRVYADENAVSIYVEGISSSYSYFKYKDRFITHGGDRIDVDIAIQEQTVDAQALTAMIVQSITNGVSGSYVVPYSGAVNFDGSYIEVSIPEQHLWVYQDGVVVLESDVVTGNKSRGKWTPRGLNLVRGHLRQIYLMDAYFVEYWMTISLHGTYGFHDADGWRQPEEYGGDTYLTNGSGGCVNVPLENMAKMYELVPDLTPVVIYDERFYD